MVNCLLDRMPRIGLRVCVLIAFGYCFGPSSWAQQTTADAKSAGAVDAFTAIHGDYDEEVPMPQFSVVSAGHQDASALQEINAFREIVGAQSWSDMVADGTIRYGNNQDVTERARLEIRQPGEYRLDTGGDSSERKTMRMAQSGGAWQRGSDSPKFIDVRDAALGLFAFPRIEEKGFPGLSDLLIDQGIVSVEGSVLHRITLERPPVSRGNANAFTSWITMDLYFDPKTHLLEKSASCVHGGGSATMLRVFTYGQYQNIGGTLLPMIYRQTLNGQLVWNLQLDEAHINSGLSAQDFHF